MKCLYGLKAEPGQNKATELVKSHQKRITMAPNYDDIKTHFPAARIKKLMQSDEEIGKVAQATPVVVGRALEFFLASLVDASATEAREGGTKRVTAQHVKQAVEKNENFDFLVETICKPQAGDDGD